MASRPEPLRRLLSDGLVSTGRSKWADSVHRSGSCFGRPPQWRLDEVVGRVVELAPVVGRGQVVGRERIVERSGAPADGGAATAVGAAVRTASVLLLRDAQQRGEPVAWIAPEGSSFHPPDVAAHGVDLGALAVVRPRTAVQAWRAADELLRSGAFGLVVLEPEPGVPLPAMAVQVRLANLARQHGAALLWCVSGGGGAGAAGVATASLRVEVSRRRLRRGRGGGGGGGPGDDRDDGTRGPWLRTESFVCRIQAVKDKLRSRNWSLEIGCDGPPGLR